MSFFVWTFGGVFDIAYAIKNSDKLQVSSVKTNTIQSKQASVQSQSQTQKPEGQFQKKLDELYEILVDPSTDIPAKKNKLKIKKGEIEALDVEIKKQFKDTEDKLKNEGLPYEILERHYNFVKHYDNNLNELRNNLDEIDKSATDAEANAAIGKTKAFLEKVKPPKKHVPLDPNKLPHRKAEPVWIEPRLDYSGQLGVESNELKTAEQTPLNPPLPRGELKGGDNLPSPILVASNGSLKGLLSSGNEPSNTSLIVAQASNPPTDADLAETQEIQFTAELREIATLLENNPVFLYEFVRNNIEYEPYYGSLKGSQGTLLLQGGNDFDQSSLLIALLRVSGIPARYVYGTVEIPIEKLMKWVGGVTDPNTAATILATGGIPGKLLTEGGQIKYAQMEHVWVEAYIPYANYRGIPKEANATKTWISLDPSFKIHEPNPNAIDMADLQNFNIDNYLTVYLQTVKPTTPAKDYLNNTTDYVKDNLPDQNFYNLLVSSSIIDKVLDLLPNSLPYPVTVVGSKFSTIPDTYRHRVAIELTDPNSGETILSYSAPWSTLLHKRFTLSYVPATTSDEQTITNYGGIYSTPAYLIRVKPILKLEGITVVEGTAINMAGNLICRMSFLRSGGMIDNIETNILTVGATLAIGLGAGYTTGRIVTYRSSKLEAAVNAGQSGEPIVGEYLNLIAVNYLQELDSSRKMISKTMKLIDTNRMAELMVGVDLGVSYVFDIPKAVYLKGLFIDVDYNISTAIDMAGDQTKVRRFQILSGMTSSALEHTMFEATVDAEAISAIKALQVASVQGIPIHTIDSGNISVKLPLLQLSYEVRSDIQNAVQPGKVVTVSERNIQLNNWNGVGYIVLDPVRGNGAYMINGLSGGSLTGVTSALQYLIDSGDMTEDEAKQYILSHRRQIWFLQPVDGPITSKFGKRGSKFHKGIDIYVRNWTPVRAVAKGKITKIYDQPDGYGKVVYIDHGSGVETRYAHNCEILVKVDDEVVDGQVIAKSGNTGYVESKQFKGPPPSDYPRCSSNPEYQAGAHVHFEIRLNGEAVNPEDFDMK